MAGLAEGNQYVLSSSGYSCPDKTALLLKLTDSSLKTIERYQKTKGHIRQTPSILFRGNKGIITIPVRESSDGSESFQDFKFTVQPISVPSGSSYECIQQFKNRNGNSVLDSLGRIQTKVHVSATDDSYQTTQDKMKLADEEMKKNSTKVVSQKELKATRKIKKITKHPGMTAGQTKSTHLPRPNKPTNTTSAISWTNGTPAPTSRISHMAAKGAPTTKPATSNKSYRDRIIHLLAVRPYKKPELILKLQNYGITTKDKSQLSNLLAQVATLSKDNAYTLKKSLYSEVQEDYPLYSEEEKELLSKNLRRLNQKDHSTSLNSTVPLSSTSSSSSSSSSSKSSKPQSINPISRLPHRDVPDGKTSAKPSAKPDPVRTAANKFKSNVNNKRPLLPDVADFKPPKKTRIAHNIKKLSPTPEGAASSCSPPSKYDVSSTTRQSPDYVPSHSSKSQHKDVCKIPTTEPKVKPSIGKHSPPSDVSSTSSGPEYLNKFTPITSNEQKQRYKDLFNKEYIEYKKMHGYVESIRQKFTKLKEQLHQAPKDSEEYHRIENKVLEEYTKLNEDDEHQKKESRWKELHEKLGQIKSMIAAYDNARQKGTAT